MRRTLLLPALALVAPLLASCGNGDDDPVQIVRTASAATADAGSTTMDYHAEVTGLPDDAPVDSFEMNGEGEYDFAGDTGWLNLSYPDDLPRIGGASFDSVFEGTTTYIRSELFGDLPDDAEWLRMDLEELLRDQAGIDASQVTGGSSDPTASLELLDNVSEDGVEDLGDEDVDGVTATHYRVSVELSDVYEQLDAIEDREKFEAFLEQFGDEETLTTEVWIDDDGRVVRQRLEQPFPLFGPDVETTMITTITFDEFGESVDVEIPDEDDTVDVQDLLPAD